MKSGVLIFLGLALFAPGGLSGQTIEKCPAIWAAARTWLRMWVTTEGVAACRLPCGKPAAFRLALYE